LLLCAQGVLKDPILYLSLYFKSHRQEYYDRLQRVRTKGDWEGWFGFFLKGVYETAKQAVSTAQSIMSLFDEDEKKLQRLGRSTGSVLRVHKFFQKEFMASTTLIVRKLGLAAPTVRSAIKQMEKLGMLREVTGKTRNRFYVYQSYLDILEEGTEPL